MDEFLKGLNGRKNREGHFRKAILAAPGFIEAHVQLALELRRQSKTAEAVRSLERALVERPEDLRILRIVGQLYVESGDFQRAVNIFSKIGAATELSVDDRYYFGVALYKSGKPAAAQQQLELAIKMAPGINPEAYLQLYNSHMKQNARSEALSVLEQFLRMFPKDPRNADIKRRAEKLKSTLREASEGRGTLRQGVTRPL
jgi:tetratricopeptide (TPR) repeat protein